MCELFFCVVNIINFIIFWFNAGISFGELLGPIVAGLLAKYFSYERTFSILGMIILGTGVAYLPLLFFKFNKNKKVIDFEKEVDSNEKNEIWREWIY